MSKSEYDRKIEVQKKAYLEGLALADKYADDFSNRYSDWSFDRLRTECNSNLRRIEYYERYGIKLENPVTSEEYYSINSYTFINKLNGSNRKISWPDDGKQPKGYRYCIEFSTGAFMFGEDYPTEFFQQFFDELKSYKPDNIDSHNHQLYWKLENAKAIHENFNSILQKYNELNVAHQKKRKIEKLQEELKQLEE